MKAQVQRARQRVAVVWCGRAKAKRCIEPLGCMHRGKSVEQHTCVIGSSGVVDDRLGKSATEILSARLRTYIKALHFTCAGTGQRPQCAATHRISRVIARDQDNSRRRSIFTGKLRQFCIDILKREIDAETFDVLREKISDDFYVIW
jgi:hypothetical protein